MAVPVSKHQATFRILLTKLEAIGVLSIYQYCCLSKNCPNFVWKFQWNYPMNPSNKRPVVDRALIIYIIIYPLSSLYVYYPPPLNLGLNMAAVLIGGQNEKQGERNKLNCTGVNLLGAAATSLFYPTLRRFFFSQ